MDEPGEQCPERIFEIVWRQHEPGNWVAEVKDMRSNQRRRVSSLEELEQFIQSQFLIAGPKTGEP